MVDPAHDAGLERNIPLVAVPGTLCLIPEPFAHSPTSISVLSPTSVSVLSPTSVSVLSPTSVTPLALCPTRVNSPCPTIVSLLCPTIVSHLAHCPTVSSNPPAPRTAPGPRRLDDGTVRHAAA